MVKGRINKGQIDRGAAKIPTPEELTYGLVRFSFKYFTHSEKFCFPNHQEKPEWVPRLFQCLQGISSMKGPEFRQAGRALRSHAIDWADTSEKDGYRHLPAQMQGCTPWQFSLAREELGRVHGFLLGEVFYLVWIDHTHALYQ
jgi:hypothetical protein